MKKKILVNFCPTGATLTKKNTPYLPLALEEIANDCVLALEQGVQMLHLHVRDGNGANTNDAGIYNELISLIRSSEAGREAILCVSTSGRFESCINKRSAVLDLRDDTKPDMASLTLSSLNFMQSVSINHPSDIEFLAKKMLDNNIKPELEVFDLGMLNYVHVLIKKGLLKKPYYINIILGNIFTSQLNIHHLSSLLASLPDEAIVTIGGLGRFQFESNLLGMVFTQGVRVGLEDNIYLDYEKKQLATNQELISRALSQAHLLGYNLFSRKDARKIILDDDERFL
jgi:uncharacterized protein (DUF849 family)